MTAHHSDATPAVAADGSAASAQVAPAQDRSPAHTHSGSQATGHGQADEDLVDGKKPHPDHGYDQVAIAKRMKRIEGQVRGIGRMIDQDTYCIDVLTQISAVTAALHAVGVNLLESHMNHCVVEAAQESPEAGAAKIAEATAAIQRLIKS